MRFDISCKLSPKKTICTKWQSLFIWETCENTFTMSSSEIFNPVCIKDKQWEYYTTQQFNQSNLPIIKFCQ